MNDFIMSELIESDFSRFKEDPELLKVLLVNKAEKVFPVSSDDDLSPHLKEILLNSALTESISKSIQCVIDNMWTEQNISKKFKDLQRAEKKNPPDFIAWRPTTGIVPENDFKATALQFQKHALLKKLETCKTLLAEQRNELNTKELLFNKYCKKFPEAEEHVITVYNLYEKIIDMKKG